MQLRIMTEPQQGATYDDLLAVAQESERLGFDAFFRSDHFQRTATAAPWPRPHRGLDHARRPGPRDQPHPARHDGHVRDLPAARACWRSRWRQVDAMSGGRVELGSAPAGSSRSTRAYGIPFPPVGERFDMLEEQLAIITGLWSTPVGETFSFDGRALHADRQPGAAQAGPATRTRRSSSAAPAPSARPAGWPRGSPTSTTCRSGRSTSPPRRSTGCAARASGGRDPAARWCSRRRRPSAVGRDEAEVAVARPPSAGTPADCAMAGWRHARRGGRQDRRVRRARRDPALPPGPRPRRPRPPAPGRRTGGPARLTRASPTHPSKSIMHSSEPSATPQVSGRKTEVDHALAGNGSDRQ